LTAEEDFHRMVTLVDETLASYKVPHNENWLIYVKVFGYVGWSGPTHILNVYLKSGGNHCKDWGKALTYISGLVDIALKHDSDACFLVLGDLNESADRVYRHLNAKGRHSPLTIAPIVGSTITHFPIRGKKRSLDHILLNHPSVGLFKCIRVLRN
jgi:hypothetical protein